MKTFGALILLALLFAPGKSGAETIPITNPSGEINAGIDGGSIGNAAVIGWETVVPPDVEEIIRDPGGSGVPDRVTARQLPPFEDDARPQRF